MRVIIRFSFKRFFPRMKNNFKDTSPKRFSGVPKINLKKKETITQIHSSTIHFHSHVNKRLFGISKGNLNKL